jgi:putative acetyltransferase
VMVLGHPEYYLRFGFSPAHLRGLCCEFAVPPEVFMLLELSSGVLHGHSGVIRYHPAFQGV